MAFTMQHGAYIAEVEIDEEVGIFHGRTINMRDIVTFEGKSISELKREFAKSVKVYLDWCKADGVEPEKPFTGKFLVRVPPEVHRAAVAAAAQAGKSLNAWITETIGREAFDKAG